jgi:transposase
LETTIRPKTITTFTGWMTGLRLSSRRLPEGQTGIGRLHALIASHAEEPDQVVIGIETDRDLWVEALVAAGYQVFAINPLAVACYRERHHVSGAKSDAADAKLLADLVRGQVQGRGV